MVVSEMEDRCGHEWEWGAGAIMNRMADMCNGEWDEEQV